MEANILVLQYHAETQEQSGPTGGIIEVVKLHGHSCLCRKSQKQASRLVTVDAGNFTVLQSSMWLHFYTRYHV